MSQPEIPRGAQKYRMWANECQSSLATLANSIWSKARSLRSRIPPGGPEGPMNEALNSGISGGIRSKNGQNAQLTDPSTGESRDESSPKMTKMANERTLQQGNSMRKVRKNERNLQNPVKNVTKPRTCPEASRNTRGSLTRHNVRLCTNFTIFQQRSTVGLLLKTRLKRTV